MKKTMALFLTVVMLFTNISAIYAADDISKNSIDTLYNRSLTDDQLQKLLNSSANQVQKEINTIADARAFLDMRFPSLWHSYQFQQGAGSTTFILRSGEEILNDTVESDAGKGNAGRSDIITAITYLLCDDYQIGSLYGFRHDHYGEPDPIMAANYININDQYIVFDPVIGMIGDMQSRWRSLLPEKTVSTLEEYAEDIAASSILADEVDSLYAVTGGQNITFTDQFEWVTVTIPNIDPLYANEKRNLSEDEYLEKKYGHIKAENINKYQLPKLLGGVTLTTNEVKALVGKEPSIIQDKVKTSGDLFAYMLAARMLLKNGDEQIYAGGYDWHYNPLPNVTLSENLGNCGRMANLANYLLEDDYDEIGFVLHSYYPGYGGGHVYNYIKYENKYYIVDFSSYLFNDYDVNNEFNFLALTKLEDYGRRWNECYGGLAAIIVHKSTGTHLPNVWDGNGYYFPEEASFNVLLETPQNGYEVRTIPCPPEVPRWDSIERYRIYAIATSGGTVAGSGTVDSNTTVTVTATPSKNYTFDGWYEDGIKIPDAQAVYQFTATKDRTLEARFITTLYSVTITAAASTGGAVTGGGTVDSDTIVTVMATPNKNYTFDGWFESNSKVSEQTEYSFTATTDRILEARFTANYTIKLNPSNKSIAPAKTVTLKATITPVTVLLPQVKWSSSNKKVAIVSQNGVITAIAPGKTTITAELPNGKKTICNLTVKPIAVSKITLSNKKLTIQRKKSATLTAKITPTNATKPKLTWSSSNTQVATVNQKGKVTAKKVGTATITAKSSDGKKQATCKVTVTPK